LALTSWGSCDQQCRWSKPSASPRLEENDHEANNSGRVIEPRCDDHRWSCRGQRQAEFFTRFPTRPRPSIRALRPAQNNCTACHSADYIKIQPEYKKDFWQVEATKKIKLYGAPIDEADVPKIVDYLASTY
jgi:hypothetical protein